MASRREAERRQVKKADARKWAEKQTQGGESTAVQLPSGVTTYKLEVGKHKIDVIPFVTGEGNPNADAGMEHFERTFFVHWVPVGAGKNKPFLCRKECFRKKCAVCDWCARNKNTADEEVLQSMRAKGRQVYLVNDKPGDTKNPLKVFETFLKNKGAAFGEQIGAACGAVDDYADFADLENGYTLIITVAKQSMGSGGTYNAVTRIDFVPRKHKYPESVRDKAPCLDDLLVDPGYEEVMKLLDDGPEDASDDKDDDRDPRHPSRNGTAKARDDDDEVEDTDSDADDEQDNDDEDDAPPSRKPASRSKGKEKTAFDLGLKEGDVVVYKGKECDVINVSGDGTSLKLEDSEGKTIRAVNPNDCEKVKTKEDEQEDTDDDDTPRSRRSSPPRRSSRDVDDDEDDADDEQDADEEEDDEPAPRSRSRR